MVVISTLFVGIAMKIQEKIRFMRESRHWSQEEMADKLGMSTNGYAKIERGETRAFIPKLEQIAEAFEVDLMELLSFGEKNFFAIGDSNNGFCNITGTSELAFEIQKLQLVVSHKDELLVHQKQEITHLREMVALLKEAKSG
jgi:transcriptional regulator with XRE-family HTH domain